MKALLFSLGVACIALAGSSATEQPKMDRSKLLIGTYYLRPYAQTERHVADLKACGIDFVCNMMKGDTAALDLFVKYGVGAVVCGYCPGWFGGDGKRAGQLDALHPASEYEAMLAKNFRPHPAVWMVDLADEPSALDFKTLADRAKLVRDRTGLTPYLNLYPNYAQVAKNTGKDVVSQLGTATYAEHLERYAKEIPLDYLSYDFYVYSAPASRPNGMIAKFYENFRNAAQVCRRTNRSLWVIPQVNSNRAELWLSENMLRFQANQCLAFGAEVINWACYTAGWWTNQVVDARGEKTRQYERLKNVNAELHAMGPAYMRYRTTATHLVGFGPAAGEWFVEKDWPVYRGSFETHVDNGFFTGVCLADGRPITVGEMVSRDGSGKVALFVADAGDPWDKAPTLRHDLVFRCAGQVAAQNGKGKVAVSRDAEGLYRVPLAANGSLLITAEMASVAEPRWSFDDAPTREAFRVHEGNRVDETNRLVIFPAGSDVTLSPNARVRFPAAARPFFAMRYRAVTKRRVGGVFFTTDELPSLCDRSFSSFGIVGDGTWRTLVVDLRTYGHRQWKGCVTGLRLDPLNPSDTDSEFDLAKMGFFASRAEAERFCASGDLSVAFTRDLTFSGPTYRVSVAKTALRGNWRRENFTLKAGARVEGPAMVCRDGESVPSFVNSRGFAWYLADRPGAYTLEKANVRAKGLSDAEKRRLGCDVFSPLPRAHFTRERIRLGGWGLFGGSTFREEQVRDFAACGMDYLIANTLDSSIHRADLLRVCNRLGVEVILSESSALSDPEHAGLDCADQPSFSGHQLRDEPGSDQFPALGRCAARYAKATGRLPFINLLPMYANAAQLKFGAHAAAIKFYDADPDRYRKHCEAFCANVDVPYLSTDIYPLSFDANGRRQIYSNYVESINIAADVARRHNREFWCYVLCYPYRNEVRGPSAAEIRWQCYSMLSFGCRNILAWIYHHLENTRNPGLVTREGARTAAWYNTRTAFLEVRRLSGVYCRYRNLGAFTHNCSKKTPYLKMSNELRDFAPIRGVTCDAPLLIGCFAGKSEPAAAAFTLVNMSELATGETTIVTLDLGGKTPTIYRGGVAEKAETDAAGRVTIPLALGEGVFVTL